MEVLLSPGECDVSLMSFCLPSM